MPVVREFFSEIYIEELTFLINWYMCNFFYLECLSFLSHNAINTYTLITETRSLSSGHSLRSSAYPLRVCK